MGDDFYFPSRISVITEYHGCRFDGILTTLIPTPFRLTPNKRYPTVKKQYQVTTFLPFDCTQTGASAIQHLLVGVPSAFRARPVFPMIPLRAVGRDAKFRPTGPAGPGFGSDRVSAEPQKRALIPTHAGLEKSDRVVPERC